MRSCLAHLFWGLALVACADQYPRPPPSALPDDQRDFWAEAQAANARSDYLGAYALARNVRESSPKSAEAKVFAQALYPRVERVTLRLLQKADDAASTGFVAKSVQLYAEVLERCPLMSAERSAVEKKHKAASAQLAKLRKEYDDKLRLARTAMGKSDAVEAYRALNRANDIANDQGFPWTFLEEQQLELARSELPPAQREASLKKRRHATSAMPKEEQAIVGAVDTFAGQEQEISRLKSVRDLIERARDYHKRSMFYEAIVALEEARHKDPESSAVKALLETLEEQRLRLVDEYLEIGDRYFAKQDLKAAVPYFRRVLKLDGENLRAKEAIQMYQNLERIKQERGAAAPGAGSP